MDIRCPMLRMEDSELIQEALGKWQVPDLLPFSEHKGQLGSAFAPRIGTVPDGPAGWNPRVMPDAQRAPMGEGAIFSAAITLGLIKLDMDIARYKANEKQKQLLALANEMIDIWGVAEPVAVPELALNQKKKQAKGGAKRHRIYGWGRRSAANRR